MYTAIRKSLNKENDKGFTLIELLVVIIIIGILAAIAIPIFLSQRMKGFEASQKSDARTLATQMETWFTDSQEYPGSVDVSQAVDGPVVFGPAGEEVFLSPNNTAALYVDDDGGSFCVLVSSTSTDNTAVYDSAAGGLQGMVADASASTTSCAGAVYTTPVELIATA